MSFYGGDFFGGYFHEYGGHSSVSGPFFDGPFFGGGFFGDLEESEQPIKARPGDEEGKKRKLIYKPTGLPPFRRKTVEDRVQETREIERETLEPEVVPDSPPVYMMSMVDIEAEIGALLRKKLRTEDEEIMLLLLLVAAA
jgi:hypothetical protein